MYGGVTDQQLFSFNRLDNSLHYVDVIFIESFFRLLKQSLSLLKKKDNSKFQYLYYLWLSPTC